jgi:hypothetical protein
MAFVCVDTDRAVQEFNVSALYDPGLKPDGGPSQAGLIQIVYRARHGDRAAAFELTDTMYYTLRAEAFECFQRMHGPRAIGHRDWFYSKLSQYLEILIYEKLSLFGVEPDGRIKSPQTDKPWEEGLTVIGTAGPYVQPDDIEAAFAPRDNDPTFWGEIVDSVCAAPSGRLAVLEGVMGRLRREKESAGPRTPAGEVSSATRRTREWRRTRNRNRIIRNLLDQGKDGRETCTELDKLTIQTLPIMQEHGIVSWVEGWDNDRFQRNIQQLFSKKRPRR